MTQKKAHSEDVPISTPGNALQNHTTSEHAKPFQDLDEMKSIGFVVRLFFELPVQRWTITIFLYYL